MQYDPIKRSLGNVFNKTPFLRVVFYKLLDVLLLRAWHIKKEIRQLGRKMPSGPAILDAGSGFGQYSHFMAKKFSGSRILGVDVKEEQIDDCNRFFTNIGLGDRVKFEVADLTLFEKAGTYDLILSVDVMEHIAEDVKVFGHFQKSLTRGGVLLISTPSDQGGSDVHGEEEESFIEEHVRDGYNIGEIRDKLLSAGFSRVEARYSYGAPGKISWKLSMKYPIIMLNTSRLFFVLLPFWYIVTFPFSLILNFIDVRIKHRTGTGLIVKAFK